MLINSGRLCGGFNQFNAALGGLNNESVTWQNSLGFRVRNLTCYTRAEHIVYASLRRSLICGFQDGGVW